MLLPTWPPLVVTLLPPLLRVRSIPACNAGGQERPHVAATVQSSGRGRLWGSGGKSTGGWCMGPPSVVPGQCIHQEGIGIEWPRVWAQHAPQWGIDMRQVARRLSTYRPRPASRAGRSPPLDAWNEGTLEVSPLHWQDHRTCRNLYNLQRCRWYWWRRMSRHPSSWARTREAASIWIPAMGKAQRGMFCQGGPWTRTNEPAMIHHSSFGEGKGGGLDSFIVVLT